MTDNVDDAESVVIIRFSEIALKSHKVRIWMRGRLRRNLEHSLRSGNVPGRVEENWGRIYIWTEDLEGACEAASRVFGVRSLSPAVSIEYADLNDLLEKTSKWAGERVRGRRFAVRARRDKNLPFTSMDIMRGVGERLKGLGQVDLDTPEVTVNVEVRGGRAYLFSDVLQGPGGLPLGTQGRALSLLSGGFDSAVASWYIMRRGVEVDFVNLSLGGPLQMRDALLVASTLSSLWSHGYNPTLHLVDFTEVLSEIERGVGRGARGVVLRHLFYRAAEMIADEEGQSAIVTGESIGQVSSQTLPNLSAASFDIEIPVMRPLLGMDKEEIVNKAREIGTAELSEKVAEYCAITGASSVNMSRRNLIRNLEKINMKALEDAVEGRWKVHLPHGTEPALDELTKRIEEWRYPDSGVGGEVVWITHRRGIQVDAPEGFPLSERKLQQILGEAGGGELPRGYTYVFSCPTGGWAVRMVSILRGGGYSAYYKP